MHCSSHSAAIRSNFFNVSTATAWGVGEMFICGKYQIFYVSPSLGIRFEFLSTHIGVVFPPSVSMSAIHIIHTFFHAFAYFSSIRFVKTGFGFSKGSISGSFSFGFFLYGVRLCFLFLLFSTTSRFVFS